MATVAEINGKLSLDATAYLTSVGKAQSSTKSLETALGNLTSALTSMERAVSRLSSQLGDIDAPARRSGEGVRQMGDSAQRAAAQTEQLGHSADRSGSMLGAFGSKMMTVGVMATSMFAAFAGYKVMNFAKDAIIGFNSTLEGAQMMMGRMLGSEEKATTFINDLKEFAIQTPFQFQDLIKASQQFMVYGWNPDNILRDMETIGSAAMGDKYKIDMITRALGQMKAKGRVSSEEISMQLGESGIPGWRYVAEFFGVTIPEAMKLAEKNALNVDDTIQAILAGMQRDFGGGMLAASKTFQGAMSNVKDAAQQALAEGFRPLFTVMSEGMLKLANFLMSDKFQKATQSMKGIAEDLAGPVAKKVDEFISKLEGLNPQKAVDKFKDLTKNLGDFKEVLGPLIGLMAGLKLGIGFIPGAIIGMIGSTDEGRNALADLGKALMTIVKDVAPDLTKILMSLTPLITLMAEAVAMGVKAFAALPGPIKTAVAAAGILYMAFSRFRPMLAGVVSQFGAFRRAAAGAAVGNVPALGGYPEELGGMPGAGPSGGMFSGGLRANLPTGGIRGIGSTLAQRAPAGLAVGATVAGLGSAAASLTGQGQNLQNTVGLMGAGAGIGMMVGGPMGALIGGVAGGAIGFAIDQIGKSSREAAAEQEKLNAQLERMKRIGRELVDSAMPDFYETLGKAGENAFTGLTASIVMNSPHLKRFQRAAAEMGVSVMEIFAAFGKTHGRNPIVTFTEELGLTEEQANKLIKAMPELGRSITLATNEAFRNAVISGDMAQRNALLADAMQMVGDRMVRYKKNILDSGIESGSFEEILARLEKKSKDVAQAFDVSTMRTYRQTGSFKDVKASAEEFHQMLSDQLVRSLGVSRMEADLLAGALTKVPTKKIVEIELKKSNFDQAMRFALHATESGREEWIKFRETIGQPVTWEDLAARVEQENILIKKIIDRGLAEQIGNDKQLAYLAWSRTAFPEIAGLYDAEVVKILERNAALEKGKGAKIAYLESQKILYPQLTAAIEEYENKILGGIVASGKSKAMTIADLEAIKVQYAGNDGVISKVQQYIDFLNGIPDVVQTTVLTVADFDLIGLQSRAYEISQASGFVVSVEDAMKYIVSGLQGFASGGRVASGGAPVVVGENGPELFYPGKSGGYVVPNNKLPSAMPMSSAGNSMTVGNITITINGAADPVATAREVRKELLKTGQRNGSALGRYA